MSQSPLYLGIDLGTTNSTAAVFDGEKVVFVRNAQGSTLTPSVVRIDAKGTTTVGARARKFLETDPQNTRAEFKRLMGTAQPIAFAAAKLSRQPEELAAEVLRSLRADVREQLGFEPVRAVISVPALFELPQSAATSEAARLAGFERVELIQEPVASALAAGWTREGGAGHWLVYDLGGGTFDASLLETRDGLLRVVGHDGDNFLGGRDVDWAIVDWALAEVQKQGGARLLRSEPAHAPAIRQVKQAAEEAKIELSRADQATLTLLGLRAGDESIDAELTLDRATFDGLVAPLVDRSIAVCQRLLQTHHVESGKLDRIVLVGGPTAMASLRARLREALGPPFGEGLDPMTLVAQGAALYATTSGLDARPAEKKEERGHRLWLQHPAMSSDLTPHVIGRKLEGGEGVAPTAVRLERADGLWKSPVVMLDEQGAFVLTVELVARKPNVFRIVGLSKDAVPVPVLPATLTIVQGLTISDPPLSRTVGVALANDQVREYFRRGAPLPARRTYVHHTVQSVVQGSPDTAIQIPIIQGEFEAAHLCRLVGSLEISGQELKMSLPAGSAVEITLELDRGGRLSANAFVPALQQVFSQVAHLLVPDAAPEVLEASLVAMRERVRLLPTVTFRAGGVTLTGELGDLDAELEQIAAEVAAARGGDADAGQKAKRSLLELDARLEKAEVEQRWPELEQESSHEFAWASRWVSDYGTKAEQSHLSEASEAIQRARVQRDPVELQRQLRLVNNLGNAAYYRHPESWRWAFEHAASRVDEATDLPKAQLLVRDGRRLVDLGQTEGLRSLVEQLWRLLPSDAATRKLGHQSGVR